jgi:hypothetical protein
MLRKMVIGTVIDNKFTDENGAHKYNIQHYIYNIVVLPIGVTEVKLVLL